MFTFYEPDDEVVALRAEVARWKLLYEEACMCIAEMHEAAVGEVRGPILGVVEDVAEIRERMLEAENILGELRRLSYLIRF
jgi:hypothetical protein